MTDLPQQIIELCYKLDWSTHWTVRGAYLHLEASELIEAIRGKHGDPTQEAADVLIVLMSITQANNIPWDNVLQAAQAKVQSLEPQTSNSGISCPRCHRQLEGDHWSTSWLCDRCGVLFSISQKP